MAGFLDAIKFVIDLGDIVLDFIWGPNDSKEDEEEDASGETG